MSKPRRSLSVVIMAAGEGKRMRSPLPKVLLDLLGRPVVGHVIDVARTLKPERIVVVGGKRLEEVKQALREEPGLTFVRQPKPSGTAHAVKYAMKALPTRGACDVMILNGDGPLVTTASLKRALAKHRRVAAEVTVISAKLPDPTGLGRIVRDTRGRFVEVVEERDATPEQRGISETNAGQYVVRLDALRRLLPKVKNRNAQKEYYLTDLIGLASKVAAVPLDDPEEARGLNDPAELATVRRLMRRRILDTLATSGVEVQAPELTYVESGVCVGAGTVLHPFTVIRRGVSIAPRCSVGPFAHLRPGTVLEEGAAVGAFVEVKGSTLAEGVKALHLAFLGDAEIGAGANVGAGTITANWDGQDHHATIVEDGVHLGSGTVLVAPVTVGSKGRTGAGAVVPAGRDVKPGETVVGVPARTQTNAKKDTKGRRRRPRRKS